MQGLGSGEERTGSIADRRGYARNLPAYQRDRLGLFRELAREGPAVVPCRLGNRGYLLNDPADVEHVLRTNAAGYQRARRMVGLRPVWRGKTSLYTGTGAGQQRKRRMIQPLLHAFSSAKAHRALAGAAEAASAIEPREEVEVAPMMRALTRRSMLDTLVEPGDGRLQDALTESGIARKRFMERLFLSPSPWPELAPRRVNLDYLVAMRRAHGSIEAETKRRRRSGDRPVDLLSALIDARDEEGRGLSDPEIEDEVLTLALTGFESVGEALGWTLLLLARHPEADRRAAEEAAAWSGEEPPIAREMPYTTAVVREALRLYPPTWLSGRVATGDDRLPSGATIRKGERALVCAYALHRDPGFWAEPEHFRPERFIESPDTDRPRFAYLPFGGGPRVCIGQQMALAELVAAVAGFARARRFTPGPGSELPPRAGLTLSPARELRLRAYERTSAPADAGRKPRSTAKPVQLR
ncbi:MAG TPA: cytochrome P450 [Solirubrobacterales bacterium]|nr:cytochrome P450 [Solirubrobacterales bacterium]